MGIIESLKRVVSYMSEFEQSHYEESDNKENHIYNDVKKIEEWLDSPSCPLTNKEED